MHPIFNWTKENPYHISVGVVLQREDGCVCCHHFGDVEVNPIRPHDLYILMRESINDNEPLEVAAARGLMEEFGAIGTPVRFLGTLLTHHPEKVGVIVEKTTPYILCKLVSQDDSLRGAEDEERDSVIEWLPVAELIEKMKEHHKIFQREDAYEVPILERL